MEDPQQFHDISKITDYFPKTPGKSPVKGDSTEERKLSDILPTPEASPVKDKTESRQIQKSDKLSETQDSLQIKTTVTNNEPVVECEEKTAARTASDKSSEKIPNKSTTNKASRKRGGRRKKVEVDNKTTTETRDQALPRSQQSSKSTGRKQKKDASSNNHLLTDYFPVRRSGRQTVSTIKKDEQSLIEDAVLNGKEIGLKVVEFEGKGRGVVASKNFRRGGFVVEYAGNLIDLTAAKEREAKYAERPDKYGCYMYYFSHKNKNYCVDATLESGRLGRLLNHSKKGNCHTKLTEVNGEPRLIFVASRDIENGEELLYDYGDRSKSSMEAHPWLKL